MEFYHSFALFICYIIDKEGNVIAPHFFLKIIKKENFKEITTNKHSELFTLLIISFAKYRI